MAANNSPPAETHIDAALVRGLLQDQAATLLPHLERLEGVGGIEALDRIDVVEVAAGWDNVIFRLGTDLLVRLPRRDASAVLLEHEQQWLPLLAPGLPLPIPAPLANGRPGRGYPWSWSVCRWFSGTTAAAAPPDDPEAAAATLADFLTALHRPAPPDAPANPNRGVPLRDRDARLRAHVEQMAGALDGAAVLERWAEAVATPEWAGPPLWVHGDVRPANLLVEHGRLSAVIDFGDISGGDPATDLAIAWMMFAPGARAVFRERVAVDDDTWARARGWALALGVAFVASSADDPVLEREGYAVVDAVLTDGTSQKMVLELRGRADETPRAAIGGGRHGGDESCA